MSLSEARARARRGLVLEHHPYAPAGRLADWADARGIALDVARPAAGERLPEPRGFDFAVVLGADASLADEPRDWVADELNWLRAVDAAGLPVLGICFGGQALARAFGGAVERSAEPEIGWITTSADAGSGVPAGPWFTWHDDRFSVPPGGVELARSARCSQAFALRSHLAVQFHPEVTDEIVDDWMRAERRRRLGDSRPGLLTRPGAEADGAQRLAGELFDTFLRRAGLDR